MNRARLQYNNGALQNGLRTFWVNRLFPEQEFCEELVIDIAIEEIIDKLYLNVLNMIMNTMKWVS